MFQGGRVYYHARTIWYVHARYSYVFRVAFTLLVLGTRPFSHFHSFFNFLLFYASRVAYPCTHHSHGTLVDTHVGLYAMNHVPSH
jgi:hypothetical protein